MLQSPLRIFPTPPGQSLTNRNFPDSPAWRQPLPLGQVPLQKDLAQPTRLHRRCYRTQSQLYENIQSATQEFRIIRTASKCVVIDIKLSVPDVSGRVVQCLQPIHKIPGPVLHEIFRPLGHVLHHRLGLSKCRLIHLISSPMALKQNRRDSRHAQKYNNLRRPAES